ncbi:MAG TPA: MBL fold metallo-hydrolase [Dehalococcoidia bacterium]|nr:MBL fold metallo-hydrolase [Dehalococcoidia bacterium]
MPKIDVLMEGYGLGTDQGIIGFCAVVLIEGEKRVLFDSAHVGRRSLLLARLRERGLTPRDIDAQVLSHSHWDHVQNVDLFDHAALLLHPNERRYASRPHENDWATPKWTGAVIESLPLVEVGEGYEVMPGCRVVELIGHSAGSIGLEVETDDGKCLVVGDALPNARAALTGNISFIFWNEAQAIASAKRISASGAAIYPGHDRPFRLKDGEVQYLTEYRLQVNGVGPETPGATFVAVPPPAPSWVMPGIETQRLD